jgi:predicted TIM-barrel fold metal-dependent hydrolase
MIPRSFVDSAIDNMSAALEATGVRARRSALTDMYLRKLQDPLCDELVAEMDSAGIDRAVLLVADFTYALRDCALTIDEMYKQHQRVLQRHPERFIVFGGMDPRWGADGVRLFERSVREFGFRGLKLYPPCGFSPSDPTLDPYYEICQELGLPVLLHIGPTIPRLAFDTTYPFMVDDAARRFPGVKFILGHGAVSFSEECAMLCEFRPNVFMEVSGFQNLLTTDHGVQQLRTLVDRRINHKILFGTDWPVFRMKGRQKGFVDAFVDGPVQVSDRGDDVLALILARNFERLARIDALSVLNHSALKPR